MKTCINRPAAAGVWQSSIHFENVYSVFSSSSQEVLRISFTKQILPRYSLAVRNKIIWVDYVFTLYFLNPSAGD